MDSLTSSEGFYTQQEAGRLLQVSRRTLYNYRLEGRVRAEKRGVSIYYLREDIDKIYHSRSSTKQVASPDYDKINDRIRKLEKTVEVLKLGLGFGKAREPLTQQELMLFHMGVMDNLAKPGWSIKKISAFADELMSIREEDLRNLCKLRGERAWSGAFDLLQRMLLFVENHRDFPDSGLGTLHARLLRARDRTYGIVHVSRIVSYSVGPDVELLDLMPDQQEICAITAYMIEYTAYQAATYNH